MKQTQAVYGNNIVSIKTLKSWYDNDCIEVLTEDEAHGQGTYRLNVSDLIPVLPQTSFKAEKKRKHTYLIPQKTPDFLSGFYLLFDALWSHCPESEKEELNKRLKEYGL